MKKLLTTLSVLFLAALSLLGSNRYANSTDVANDPGVSINDVIWDTPFNTASARGQIYVPNIASTWGSIRFGGTIWLDANTSTIAEIHSFYIDNGGTIWSGVSDEDHPITIRPLHGQVRFLMSAASNTARMVLIADIPNIEFNGYLEAYPGMKYPWSGALHNTFGFLISGDATLSEDPFQLMIDGPSGMNTIAIKNVEIEGGYSALRIMPGNTSLTLKRFTCERMYMHDTLTGEMFYVGQTTGTPYAVFEEVIIRDVLCVRSGTEGIQLQHIYSHATRWSYQENFVVYAPASDWKNPFQQYQDNGVQDEVDKGRNIMRNGIIDGAANTQLSVLATAATPNGDPIIFDNILLNNGRYIGMYTGTVASGSDWIFRNLYFKDFNNTYPELSEGSAATYVISENNSDFTSFHNITWDNSRSSLFQSSTGLEIIGTQQDNAMPDIEYLKPPFPGKTVDQYELYTEEYASWSTRAGDKVDYVGGAWQDADIVGEYVPGSYFRFYICSTSHTSSSSTHPHSDASHWTVITYDSNGWPSYHPNWTSGGTQTYYSWDDLRLASNSTWNVKGMGLSSNERNTAYSTYQWYIADDASGTNSKQLAGKVKLEWNRSTEDIGRYSRLKVYFKDEDDNFTEYWINDWEIIN